jgi:hypothetical protein
MRPRLELISLALDVTAMGCAGGIHEQDSAQHALAVDSADFNTVAIIHLGYDRNHSGFGKVRILNWLVRLVQTLANH